MKRGRQHDKPIPAKGTLDYHFAKMRTKAVEIADDDDSVVFVKEVKSPADKDPDWAASNWAASNGVEFDSIHLKESDNNKPRRLKDVLRRRQAKQLKASSTAQFTNIKENKSENNNATVDSECSSTVRNLSLPEDELIECTGAQEQQDSLFVRLSPKRKKKSPSVLSANHSCSYASVESFSERDFTLVGIEKDVDNILDENSDLDRESDGSVTMMATTPNDGEKSGIGNDGESSDAIKCAAPSTNHLHLSLKVLDSQEYYPSENEDENQSEDKTVEDVDLEEEPLHMDVSLLPSHPLISSHMSSGPVTSSQVTSSNLISTATSSDTILTGIMNLSDSSGTESDTDVFNPITKANNRSRVKDQTVSDEALKEHKPNTPRKRVSKQLFANETSLTPESNTRPTAVSTPVPVRKSIRSHLKTGKSPGYRSHRGNTWGPKCVQRARKIKMAELAKQADIKKELSSATKSINSKRASPKRKQKLVQKRKRKHAKSSSTCKMKGKNLGDPGRSFTPDDDLEETMLSLDETNTYSPTKLSQEPRPITPDNELEEVMLTLNESNTYSPTKLLVHRIPYYLASVRSAIDEITMCPIDVQYLDVDDCLILDEFNKLKVQSQLMYLRMLFRNFDWIPKSKLKYDEIPDIDDAVEKLLQKSFVQHNGDELPLEELLNMLPVPRLKKVCKDMKIGDKQKRAQLIKSMMEHANQRTAASMFKIAVTVEDVMAKRVREELPVCYKLRESTRSVFMRVLMLYALVFDVHSGSKEHTQSQLIYTMLREAVGQIKFPQVPRNRQTKIFMDREHVLRRQQGQDIEEILDGFLQKKNFEAGLPWIETCKQYYQCWMGEATLVEHDERLPSYLRRYTCTNQMLRCLGLAAELLQKLKQYQQAADLFELMLSQQIYSVNSRGYWYERLSVLYQTHIKDGAKAAAVIVRALEDNYVQVGYRLSIYQRGLRLQQSKPKKQIGSLLDNIKHEEIGSYPTTEIVGDGRSGTMPDTDRVNVFLNADTRGRITTCSVENIAMEHYKTTFNLDKGLHAESSVFTTMFGLLFWDIIYKPGIPDTFFNNFQFKPLDFQSDEFYLRRKEDIDKRLEKVRQATPKELSEFVEPVWNECFEQCSICVIWTVFESAQDALDLMLCLGTPLLADICGRLAKNYRFCRSGMPDLTMWNAETGKYKIVEVKGPNDKLSSKQILWLDYLVRKGADAEVCYVKIGSRKDQVKTGEDAVL